MKPNFLVIGAAKSATTSLCDLFNRHPRMFICEPKEPDFFANDAIYARGMAWYEMLFEAAGDKPLRGDGSTSYTKHWLYPKAAERIARELPDAKLIYIVRHPIRRMESAWLHGRSLGAAIPADFSRAIRRHANYIDGSLYWRQIGFYREHFADDRILVLFFEDFCKDPQAVLRQCYRFLGAPEIGPIEDADRPRNAAADHLDRWWLGALRRVPGFGGVRLRRIPRTIRTACDRLLSRPQERRPKLDRQTQAWAMQSIGPDARQFLAFYGKPADYWTLDEAPASSAAPSSATAA